MTTYNQIFAMKKVRQLLESVDVAECQASPISSCMRITFAPGDWEDFNEAIECLRKICVEEIASD